MLDVILLDVGRKALDFSDCICMLYLYLGTLSGNWGGLLGPLGSDDGWTWMDWGGDGEGE